MKTLRQLCVALTLTLAFAVNTSAGEIHTTIAPPPMLAGEIQTPVAGQMDTPPVAGEIQIGNSESGSVTAAALGLIQSLLALF